MFNVILLTTSRTRVFTAARVSRENRQPVKIVLYNIHPTTTAVVGGKDSIIIRHDT